jgi:hypothetical protein
MTSIRWRWVYAIGPAPIIEKVTHPNGTQNALFRHWGLFKTRKIYRGFKLPRAGEMAEIPNYGLCKIERVLQFSKNLGRDLLVYVVISPKSLGDDEWWVQHRNDPVVKSQQNWVFDMDDIRSYFKDLDIPEADFVEPSLRTKSQQDNA